MFALTALADSIGNSIQGNFADFESGTPTPLVPEDPSVANEVTREANGQPSHQWETPFGGTGNSGAQPTADVSALLTELIEADANGPRSLEIQHELSRNGCNDEEIVRRLSERLRDTADAKKFERILLLMDRLSYVISVNPDMKRQFVTAPATAGQHVLTSDLKKMDQRVLSLILDLTQLPESSVLLGKLATVDDNWADQVMTKLARLNSDMALEFSVKIAREKYIHPRHLRDTDSEVVCHFLWEGKLAGKEEFSGISVGDSQASIKAFSHAAAAKITSDPSGAVDSLMALFLHQHQGIDRRSLPQELLQNIDNLLSSNVGKYFGDRDESLYEAKKRAKKGLGPIAFLDLAKHLGGRKTIVAIAELGINNPKVLEKFEGIGDMLVSINEPKVYDAIVMATAFHGQGRSNAIANSMGQAIEPNFLRRLQAELQSKPTNKEKNDWVKRVSNLVEVIQQIGTAKSIPVLTQLAGNKNSLLKGSANKILQKIGPAPVATGTPAKTKPADAKSANEIEPTAIKVSTNSGETFRSSIDNIVQGRILRSSLRDKLSFDSKTMWHSGKLESGWAKVELEFPERVVLDKIQIYSGHSGKNHPVVAARVFSVEGRKTKLLDEAGGLKQNDTVRFKSTKSRKWRLELQAGKSKKVVVRGLRFFDDGRELYPPTELPPAKK